MAYHNELGKEGERIAANFLIKKGYHILERNFRYERAEIDIIATHKNLLIVVEVKTRNSSFFGNPQDFVRPTKIKLLVKAANYYIEEEGIKLEVRFDIIAILKNKTLEKIEHIENAFYHF